MKERAIIDSSVLVKIILEGNEKLLEEIYNKYEIFIPVNVLEESMFIIIRESIFEEFKEDRFFEIKRIFEEKEVDVLRKRVEALSKIADLWSILPINKQVFEIAKEISFKYRLLPNDAIIVASAIFNKIGTLLTFDEDFRKVDMLNVILLEDF